MRIVLIGKNYIFKKILPKSNFDNYLVIDSSGEIDRQLFNLKISDEKYEMIGSSFSSIINPECVEYSDDTLKLSETNDCIIEKITLEENSIYPILLKDVNEVYMLYCFSDYEDSYKHINIINTKEITIGSKDNNSIVFENPLVSDTHVKLYKFKEKWIIENYNSVYGIFVNDFPVYNKPKNIFNGDTIFIMGLELIMINASKYWMTKIH